MSQPNTVNQNLPNGIPAHLNGVDSSHSSRDSSPSARTYNYPPIAQLPVSSTIPLNQLPPSRQPVNQVTQNFSNLHMNHVTPSSSPILQTFGTSTPQVAKPREMNVVDAKSKPFNSTILSPISSTMEFTHSATSHFSNVPLNTDTLRGSNNLGGTDNVSAEGSGQNQAQLASRGSAPTQNNTNVPFNYNQVRQQFSTLPHQNSLPSMAPRPPLQPNKSEALLLPTTSTSVGPRGTETTMFEPPIINTTAVKLQGTGGSESIQNFPSRMARSATQSMENINSLSANFPITMIKKTSAGGTPSQMSTPDRSPTHQQNSQNTNAQTSSLQFIQPQIQNPNYSSVKPVPTPPLSQPNYKNAPTVSYAQNRPVNESVPHTQMMQNPPRTEGAPAKYRPNNSPNFENKLPMNQGDMSTKSSANQPNVYNTMANGPQTQSFASQGDMSRYPPQPSLAPMGVPNRPPMSKSMTVPPMMQQTPNYSYPHNPAQTVNQPPVGGGLNLYQKHQPPKTLPQDNASVQLQSVQQQNVPPPVNPIRNNLHSNRYPNQQMTANPIQQPPQPQSYQPQQQPYQTMQQPQQQQPYQTMQQPQQQQPYQSVQQPQQNIYQQNFPQAQPKQQLLYNQNSYNYQSGSVSQMGYNKLWGSESFDLLQCATILPPTKVETPQVTLGNELLDAANCQPDIFRCTMTKIPESSSLLQKSRLPLGVLIHPFRDLNHLPVIQCNTIVRCRACRTYINPFVFFVDNKRWKCNLCYRINELPEEFQYDPVTKTYGDPSRRPEVKTSTIEYIAPAEYMLRPPQPAVYLFLFDISRAAIESGYLHTVCNVLSTELPNLPGDTRTHIGFIAYDSALHFFSLADGLSTPHEMTVLDIDDIFLPCPDNLLVNLQDRMELISDLLAQLPNRFDTSYDTGSALGAALQAAHKMMASTGGRVTVFQASLPSAGPGSLTSREDPSQRAGSDIQHLNPANDFYKRLALECSGQQIAVDIFLLNSQYVDVATVSGISRFSGGCIYHFPLFKVVRQVQNDGFERSLKRYLTRKIGFEAVMRIRCTRGLSIHTFHGNFFVRSTDLLSLPNVNPDAGFGMQVAIEENLSDVQTVCFQAALLYTSSKGERRIRVHTMCLPVVNSITEIINSADQQCIVGLLAKMAVDRSMQSSLSDAREAFINVAIDILTSYKVSQNMGTASNGLMAPNCLRLLPLYICALLKNVAFRTGFSTRLDDRVKTMCDMKTRPLSYLIQQIYPDLYPIHNLQDQATVLNDEEEPVPMPPHLQLTARSIDSNGAYLLDTGEHMIIIVCPAVSSMFLNQMLGVSDYNSITDQMYEVPILENEHNHRLHMFINYLNEEKPMNATLQIMRDNSPLRGMFLEKFIEDRMETALSYHEFLQHLKTQVK